MKVLIAALLACGLCVFTVGCAESATAPAGAAEIINTHCPVMGGKVNPETTVDYDGKKVAFCCPPCLDEWAEMSAEEKKDALEKAAAGGGEGHGEGHEGHGEETAHGEHGETEESATEESATEESATEESATEESATEESATEE